MKKRTLFVLAILFVIAMTVIEARQDYWIITSGATAGKWKLWGNAYSFGWIMAGGLSLSYLTKRWTIVLWIPILWMVWWMGHDAFVGIFLTGNPLHIGSGTWDQFFARIFQQSGLLYMIVRMFWTTLMVLGYLSFERGENITDEYEDEYVPPLLPPWINRPSVDANDVFVPDEKLKED